MVNLCPEKVSTNGQVADKEIPPSINLGWFARGLTKRSEQRIPRASLAVLRASLAVLTEIQ